MGIVATVLHNVDKGTIGVSGSSAAISGGEPSYLASAAAISGGEPSYLASAAAISGGEPEVDQEEKTYFILQAAPVLDINTEFVLLNDSSSHLPYDGKQEKQAIYKFFQNELDLGVKDAKKNRYDEYIRQSGSHLTWTQVKTIYIDQYKRIVKKEKYKIFYFLFFVIYNLILHLTIFNLHFNCLLNKSRYKLSF